MAAQPKPLLLRWAFERTRPAPAQSEETRALWQPHRPARDAQNADVHSDFAMSECDARLCIAGIKSPSSLPPPCSSLSALPPPLRRPAVCCAAFPPSPTPYTPFSPRYGVDAALDAARQTGRKRTATWSPRPAVGNRAMRAPPTRLANWRPIIHSSTIDDNLRPAPGQ